MLASAYALKGETKCAAAEFTQARKLAGEGRYESIARVKATTRYETPEIRALAETTYLAGLRNAAISEE